MDHGGGTRRGKGAMVSNYFILVLPLFSEFIGSASGNLICYSTTQGAVSAEKFLGHTVASSYPGLIS